MGLNIKNAAVEEKVRRVAHLRGVGLTDAIEQLADAELRRREGMQPEQVRRIEDLLQDIREAGPAHEAYGSDHSDMYDESGLPLW